MTHLRKLMLEELQHGKHSEATIRAYVRAVRAFAKHFGMTYDERELRG